MPEDDKKEGEEKQEESALEEDEELKFEDEGLEEGLNLEGEEEEAAVDEEANEDKNEEVSKDEGSQEETKNSMPEAEKTKDEKTSAAEDAVEDKADEEPVMAAEEAKEEDDAKDMEPANEDRNAEEEVSVQRPTAKGNFGKKESAKEHPLMSRVRMLPTGSQREAHDARSILFAKWDPNGDGILELAEIDKGLVTLLQDSNVIIKPAVNQAYFACRGETPPKIGGQGGMKIRTVPPRGESFIEKRFFRGFLIFFQRYMELWVMFTEIDSDGDRKVSMDEFSAALPIFQAWGLESYDKIAADPAAAFAEIDEDGGGEVMFDEFAIWAIAQDLGKFEDKELDDADKEFLDAKQLKLVSEGKILMEGVVDVFLQHEGGVFEPMFCRARDGGLEYFKLEDKTKKKSVRATPKAMLKGSSVLMVSYGETLGLKTSKNEVEFRPKDKSTLEKWTCIIGDLCGDPGPRAAARGEGQMPLVFGLATGKKSATLKGRKKFGRPSTRAATWGASVDDEQMEKIQKSRQLENRVTEKINSYQGNTPESNAFYRGPPKPLPGGKAPPFTAGTVLVKKDNVHRRIHGGYATKMMHSSKYPAATHYFTERVQKKEAVADKVGSAPINDRVAPPAMPL